MNGLARTLSVLALAAATPALATAATWNVDGAHSQAIFKVKHMGIASVTGGFNDLSGTIQFDPENIDATEARAVIKTASVDTGNDKRDGHLRSDDFFNAEQYPEITFVSTGVSDVTEDTFKLHGDLTIRDVTKPVVLDVEYLGSVDSQRGARAAFLATTEVDRQAFNIRWNNTMEAGGLIVGNDVKITLELSVVEAEASSES